MISWLSFSIIEWAAVAVYRPGIPTAIRRDAATKTVESLALLPCRLSEEERR